MPVRRRSVDPLRVWLAHASLLQMLEEAERRFPDETGGMLLGYVSPGGAQIAITDVVGPGPRAIHRRGSFEPDGAWQQRRLASVYEASGRITTYLGDWHSHAGGIPVPSREDVRTARRVARTRQSRTKHPLTLILGQGPGQTDAVDNPEGPNGDAMEWLFIVYRYRRRRLHVVRASMM